jgi:hypothetical protein
MSTASNAVRVIARPGKLRNGLYLRGVALYADRISFEVFASRSLAWEDLRTLQLHDDAGTEYQLVEPEGGVIDGRAEIEFRPAVPARWASLDLGQPGWGLHISKPRSAR